MEEMHLDAFAERHTNGKREPHVIDFLTKLARRKWILANFVFGGGALFVAFTFLMPHTYSGLSTLVPPEKQTTTSGLMQFFTGSGALDLMKGRENPALDMFKNVLDSRQLSEKIAQDSLVYAYYSTWDTSRREIGAIIRESIEVEPLRNNILNVGVNIKTHWMPAKAEAEKAKELVPHLAQLLVHHLDRYNREQLMTTAKLTRIFIEGEYKERLEQLDSAYERLKLFQEEHKAISLPDQLEATVSSAAILASEVQQLEMQLAVEEREFSPSSDRIAMIKTRLDEARMQLKKYDEGGVGEYVIALEEVPQVARTLAGLMREVKLLETITAYLRQQLEQERISEQRDLPSLQVLDNAIKPKWRSSPSRFSMLLLGMFSGLFFSFFFIGWRDFREDLKRNPENHVRYLNFKAALLSNRTKVKA